MSPRVTVLMSTYNGEKYLRESIESVLNQTFSDFEFLIIDDASTDSSQDIINNYNDPRIILIENKDNIGQAESLNRGLREAKGDYIVIKTEDKNYIVHSTLKKIEVKLPEAYFLKVHRSYIINLKKIIDIEDNSVLIKKDVIPVSRSKRPELMKRLDLL